MTPLETLLERAKHLAPRVRDQHIVFDSYSPFARNINPGLDGHDHPRPKLLLVRGALLAHRRQLVNVSPDAVAESMSKPLPESGLLDDLPGHTVRLRCGDAWAQEFDRRHLGIEHDLVNRSEEHTSEL